MNQAPQLAKVLPLEARLSLAAAAKLANPFERAKAIDRAIAKARLLYPHLFKRTKHVRLSHEDRIE